MIDHGAIPATLKSGKERLTVEGKDLDFDLLGFWRWSTSDILSNTTRGKFAEFNVGTANSGHRDPSIPFIASNSSRHILLHATT